MPEIHRNPTHNKIIFLRNLVSPTSDCNLCTEQVDKFESSFLKFVPISAKKSLCVSNGFIVDFH